MSVSTKVQGLVRAAIADRETFDAYTLPNLPSDVAEQVSALLTEYEAEQARAAERERETMRNDLASKLREHGSPLFDLTVTEREQAIDDVFDALCNVAAHWSTALNLTESERWSGYGLGRFGAAIRTPYGKVKVTLTV